MTDREKVIKGLECWSNGARQCNNDCPYRPSIERMSVVGVCDIPQFCKDALELLEEQQPQWRPFVKRALTEEEQKHHPDWCYILDGEMPGDDEEILLYRPWNNKAGYIIEMDTYCNNGAECYLEGAGDIENGMYWLPLPEPPKEEENADSIRLAKICADFGLTPYGVRYALEQYQKVIVELTDGKFSKLTYPAELICDTARECFEKDHMEYWDEPPKEEV